MKKLKPSRTVAHPDQLDLLDGLSGDNIDLVEVPAAPSGAPGSCSFDQIIRDELNHMFRTAPFDRDQIAQMLSDLVGRRVTKNNLDTYTGQARPNRLPADLLPALTCLLGPSLLTRIGVAAGCAVMERQDAAFARYGQLHFITVQAKKQEEEMLKSLPLFLEKGNV